MPIIKIFTTKSRLATCVAAMLSVAPLQRTNVSTAYVYFFW